jgi:hypothetical protein
MHVEVMAWTNDLDARTHACMHTHETEGPNFTGMSRNPQEDSIIKFTDAELLVSVVIHTCTWYTKNGYNLE